jgi:prepilin-type N-terminal cleavage/methylation domain-containing protein
MSKHLNQRLLRRYSPRSRPGFTLIEMIVATVLLAIGIVGTMGAIHAASQTTLLADGAQTAALLAQKQITQMELQPDQLTGGDQQGDFGDEYAGYKWQQNTEATDYPSLFKVTMTITWGGFNDTHKREFVTYLSNGQYTPTTQAGVATTTGTTATQGSANGRQ